ncbi:radical SAM domain protein [Clostridia bacterium]|nr:radical SAM domain protein [Clostridia bacterium]
MYSDEILLQTEKPARYIGNEINMVKKDISGKIRFGFCFPDIYEVGMSCLGLQILYFLLNRREDTYCERFFAPWGDMETLLRENGLFLESLETGTSAGDFDILGFTLQYEMSYTNVLNMLDLAGIPILSTLRGEDSPIVCAGGICTLNPEPLADIFDFFYIGEAEENLDKILDAYKRRLSKSGFLREIADIDGVYVPMFYSVSYNEDGTIKEITPNAEGIKPKISRVFIEDMDKSFFPKKTLVPLVETVHNRVSVEVFRGCIRGCRFCQAGYSYRPAREKEPETLMSQAEELVASTGYDEISLVSLSTGDYTRFNELARALDERFTKDNINVSLPSLRVDAFTTELANSVQTVRKSSLTFAPEAGTLRLRRVINKNLSDEDIQNGAKLAFESGITKVKLYFMTGLPTETKEDLDGIVQTVCGIMNLTQNKHLSIGVSAACFVPKPHTPFQWEAQNTTEEFLGKHMYVKNAIPAASKRAKRAVRYTYHDCELAVIEGILARGDRRVCKGIVRAWELGARFDGWNDIFRYSLWKQAFEETGLDLAFYTSRVRDVSEILPWEHIDCGVSKEFFIRERERAYRNEQTPNCRENCSACGIGCR